MNKQKQYMSFRLLQRPCKGPFLSIRDFDCEAVGKGSFGQVYRAIHKQSKQVFAIKQISKINHDINKYKEDYQLEQINHQLLIMYQLDSEYIVRVYDHFQDQWNIYLVMQYVDGVELYKGIIQKKKRLEDPQIARVIYQLCMALKHLHERHIIHRDIKPQNIILMKTKDIKLIDFGTSNYVGPQEIRMTKTGSLPYFAPEIVRKDKHGQAVDVWCVGILLYEMFVLKTPFEQNEKTQMNILKKRVMYPSIMDPQMRDLIERILVKQQNKRLKIDEIIKHPWIIKNLYVKSFSPLITIKTKSKSKSHSKSVEKKSISKQPLTSKSHKSISISKSMQKYSSTGQESLQLKIARLQKQINQGSYKQKQQWQKKKQFLQRKIHDVSDKLAKVTRDTLKYDSIIKANAKKITQVHSEMKDLNLLKLQNDSINVYISKKKQEFLIHNQNRTQLRIDLANLQTKLRINKSSRQNSQRHSNSRSNKSSSRHKFALSNRSINNTPSLKKFTTAKSQKFTTQGSIRNSNLGDLQAYISNLSLKHNFTSN